MISKSDAVLLRRSLSAALCPYLGNVGLPALLVQPFCSHLPQIFSCWGAVWLRALILCYSREARLSLKSWGLVCACSCQLPGVGQGAQAFLMCLHLFMRNHNMQCHNGVCGHWCACCSDVFLSLNLGTSAFLLMVCWGSVSGTRNHFCFKMVSLALKQGLWIGILLCHIDFSSAFLSESKNFLGSDFILFISIGFHRIISVVLG